MRIHYHKRHSEVLLLEVRQKDGLVDHRPVETAELLRDALESGRASRERQTGRRTLGRASKTAAKEHTINQRARRMNHAFTRQEARLDCWRIDWRLQSCCSTPTPRRRPRQRRRPA